MAVIPQNLRRVYSSSWPLPVLWHVGDLGGPSFPVYMSHHPNWNTPKKQDLRPIYHK